MSRNLLRQVCALVLVAGVSLLGGLCSLAWGANPDLSKADWIWTGPAPTAIGEWECYTRKAFEVGGDVSEAVVLITADNVYELFVNGKQVGEDGGYDGVYWRSVERYDITKLLKKGRNVVAARAKSLGGFGGLVVAIRVEKGQNDVAEYHTGRSWPARKTFEEGWNEADHTANGWPRATVVRKMGESPWGMLTYPGPKSPMHVSMLSWMDIGDDFAWPAGIVYVGGYIPLKEPANFTVNVLGSKAYFEHDAACPPALGRKLYKMQPANPDGIRELLCDAGDGIIAAPAVSWDGETVYFSMVKEGDKFFHIYSIDADGAALRQLTDGPYHDYEPAELPDGRVIFCSTRLGTRDEYHGNFASSIFAMNPDGSNIEPITHHIVADHEPKVTAEGTITFVRCDNFFERAKVETRIHHVRPDGTGGMTVLGPDRPAIGYDPMYAAERNSAWLRQYGFGSVAPMSDGRIAAICQNGLVFSGLFDSGVKPPEKSSLGFVPFDVSALPDGRLLCTGPGRGWIGLIDPQTGKAAKIFSGDKVHSPVYLGPRKKPASRATQLVAHNGANPEKTGYLLCQSVFNTRQTNADISRIEAVRIVRGKPFSLRSAYHRFDHIGVEGVELGTVPLAADGSFYVEVPADAALSIQAIDAEGRSVINETSWIYVRPGERLSCVGCHNSRTGSPKRSAMPLASRQRPVKLLGKGSAHRFRANNAGNGGMLNLQYDRFREAAAITLFPAKSRGRQQDIQRLCGLLEFGTTERKISAAQALAVLRDRSAVKSLSGALADPEAAVRRNAALALSTCGDRKAVKALAGALGDRDAAAAQAINLALENLTGRQSEFDAFSRAARTGEWKVYLEENDWNAIEADLIVRLSDSREKARISVIEAMGHIGADKSRAALRAFVKDNPDAPLRTIMAAMRSLGYLRDVEAVELLSRIVHENIAKDPGKAPDLHELGWIQRPVYLTATAVEALGRIATEQATESIIVATPKLLDFWQYTFRCGDHSWLMGCQSSVIHYRMLEALDRSTGVDLSFIVPVMLKSLPIDTDRALLYETDSYENLTARIIARSGRSDEIIETCLGVLGDKKAKVVADLREAVTASPPAISVKPQDPQSRAAQIISVVCLDSKYVDRICSTLDRYRAMEPSRTRSWVCFFLSRVLGRFESDRAVESLTAALTEDATEASFGYEDPPNVFVYKAMTPFYRAAAADALGRIGGRRSGKVLVDTLTEFENAVSVRHAAAEALLGMEYTPDPQRLGAIARDYPEVETKRTLMRLWHKTKTTPHAKGAPE